MLSLLLLLLWSLKEDHGTLQLEPGVGHCQLDSNCTVTCLVYSLDFPVLSRAARPGEGTLPAGCLCNYIGVSQD